MNNRKVVSLAELKIKKIKHKQRALSIEEAAELYSQKFTTDLNLLKHKEDIKDEN